MAVENTGSLISDLDPTLPRPDDYISEGDDHIRLIKHNLQYTFPNIEAVVKVDADKLNQMDSYLDFTTTSASAGGLRQIKFQEPTLLSNGLDAVAETDYPVLKQVKELIKAALGNSVYRVGSYYISDDPTNPLQILGFGTWVRVGGFFAGAGTIAGSGDIPAMVLTAGQTGGSHSFKLTPKNIPQFTVDASNFKISDANPVANTVIPQARADGNNNTASGGLLGHNYDSTHKENIKSDPITHGHTLSGSVSFGQSNPDSISNLPPYTVTNIWKRTA